MNIYRKLSLLVSVILILGASFVVINEYKRNSYKAPNYDIEIEIIAKYKLPSTRGLYIRTIASATLTAYSAEIAQTDSTPHHTATGRLVYSGSIAASQDLFRKSVMPGDIAYVVYTRQYYIVEDCMNRRYKKCFDIFMHQKSDALAFGRQRSDVIIFQVRK